MPAMPPPPSETPASASPARMGPLAKLPVFWSLEGRKVLVAGGSEAAGWKAELLAACGATVHVWAPATELAESFAELVRASSTEPPATDPPQPVRGCFVHHDAPWSRESLADVAMAIADCESEEEAGWFFEAARAAGVPVNVIDKPAFCQFQFGSIVNRSPVVIAISTDGAAPILAQAIRRRIETLLPPSLRDWAVLAQSIRLRANGLLAPGHQRRSFWERFVDHAFSGNRAPEEGGEDILLADAARIAVSPAAGSVSLVGTGPGDPELLTLKAVRTLQSADVILFDDGVSADVLELARREARRMLVAAVGGRESCGSEDITDVMVSLARAGKRVVRLKAGDPTDAGHRGGEVARLKREGIAVDVVPGITAPFSAAAGTGSSAPPYRRQAFGQETGSVAIGRGGPRPARSGRP